MNSPKVRRITIDEKLSDNLIRILVADLKANQREFGDDPKYWGEESELLVNPENYQEELGMPSGPKEEWLWENLYEGQVFLSGGFRAVEEKGAETRFLVDVGQRNFQDIDRVSKERVKREYMAALERGS